MRKLKAGLDYYSMDVDFFDDEKVEFVAAKYGEIGELILVKLLCRIYRNCYFLRFNEDDCLLFSKRSGENITYDLVTNVVNEAIKRDFFDKNIFDKYGVLTSNGIQRRYLEATQRRKETEIILEYMVNGLNVNIKEQNVIIKSLDVDGSTQSKVKESKVKQTIIDEIKNDNRFFNIELPFKDENFETVLLHFMEYRASKYKGFEIHSLNIFLRDLKKLSNDNCKTAIELMETAMKKSWNDVYTNNTKKINDADWDKFWKKQESKGVK